MSARRPTRRRRSWSMTTATIPIPRRSAAPSSRDGISSSGPGGPASRSPTISASIRVICRCRRSHGRATTTPCFPITVWRTTPALKAGADVATSGWINFSVEARQLEFVTAHPAPDARYALLQASTVIGQVVAAYSSRQILRHRYDSRLSMAGCDMDLNARLRRRREIRAAFRRPSRSCAGSTSEA